MKNSLYNWLFWGGIAATAGYLGLYNSALKSVAIACFSLLFVLALSKSSKSFKPKIYRMWLILIILGMGVCLLRYGNNVSYAFDMAIPLMICYSSTYLLDSSEEELIKWFVPFSAFFCFCAFMSIIRGVGSFSMADYYIEGVAKNQICPFFSIISTIAVGLALRNKLKLITKLYLFLVAAICIIPAIYLLNRTSLIGFGISCAFLVYTKGKLKGLFIFVALVVMVLLISGTSITDMLYQSIVGNRDASDLDDLTSGRFDRNDVAIEYISRHLAFGEIGQTELSVNPHMFILYPLTRFGLIGGIPFLILYGTIIWLFIKAYSRKELLCAGVLFMALFESLAEYAPPFGPGTTFVVCYMIVGMFIKKYYNIKV